MESRLKTEICLLKEICSEILCIVSVPPPVANLLRRGFASNTGLDSSQTDLFLVSCNRYREASGAGTLSVPKTASSLSQENGRIYQGHRFSIPREDKRQIAWKDIILLLIIESLLFRAEAEVYRMP